MLSARCRVGSSRTAHPARLEEDASDPASRSLPGGSREKLHGRPRPKRELFNEAENDRRVGQVPAPKSTSKPRRSARTNPARAPKLAASRSPPICSSADLPRHRRGWSASVHRGWHSHRRSAAAVSEQLDYVPPKIQVLQHVLQEVCLPGVRAVPQNLALARADPASHERSSRGYSPI